jgi:hypothetical protein
MAQKDEQEWDPEIKVQNSPISQNVLKLKLQYSALLAAPLPSGRDYRAPVISSLTYINVSWYITVFCLDFSK